MQTAHKMAAAAQSLNTTYKLWEDPTHGWLEVPVQHLETLHIANEISACSFRKDNTAYLEQECDAYVFLNAYEKSVGSWPLIATTYRKKIFIRNLPRFYHK